MHFGLYAVGQVGILDEVEHLLAGKLVVGVIVKQHSHHRQSEKGGAADVGLFLSGIHGYLDRDSDEFLYFFGATSGPLRDDGDFGVSHIGKCVYGSLLEAEAPHDCQYYGEA